MDLVGHGTPLAMWGMPHTVIGSGRGEQFDQVSLRRQEEDDSPTVERRGRHWPAERHAALCSKAGDLRIKIVDFVAQVVETAALAANKFHHWARVRERLDQFDYGTAGHLDETDANLLDRIRDGFADAQRVEEGCHEVVKVGSDVPDCVADMMEAHE